MNYVQCCRRNVNVAVMRHVMCCSIGNVKIDGNSGNSGNSIINIDAAAGAAVNISFDVHAMRSAHVRGNHVSDCVSVSVRTHIFGRWRIAGIPNGSSYCVVLSSVCVCVPVLFEIGNKARHILCPNTNSMRTQFFFAYRK